MPKIRPFCAIRPTRELVKEVSSLPYDVMNRSEAKEMAKDKQHSFLHIIRSEIDLPDEIGDYDMKVYQKARENLESFKTQKVLVQDEKPMFYLYRQTMNGRVQTGMVALVSVEDYQKGIIKKHELTRKVKEEDRINHFHICNACTEPVFLAHKHSDEISRLKREYMGSHLPEYEFISEDGIGHSLWKMEEEDFIKRLEKAYEDLECFYIADGHHRSASAAAVCEKNAFRENEAYRYFMAVIFSSDELKIMDYNRLIKGFNNHSEEEILNLLSLHFEVINHGKESFSPKAPKSFGMLLGGTWYELIAREELKEKIDSNAGGILETLDVSILHRYIIEPIFGIKEITKDERIDFVGGIRGLKELERRVNLDMDIAFSMYPTSIEEIFAVADKGLIMPPKSTWFEPKLRSGLFIYPFE